MKIEALDKQQLADAVKTYLYRYEPIWDALKQSEAVRVAPENGQDVASLQHSLLYAVKKLNKKVRVLRSSDKESVIVVKA